MGQQAGSPDDVLDEQTRQFYLAALDVLDGASVPYCVAGAYALAAHASIVRHTKDLDVFVCRSDLRRAATAFERAGFRIEHTHPHWLAKAYATGARSAPGAFVDLIFRAASGLWEVDGEWLAHVMPGVVVGRTAPLCPPEELIWSKAMVMERNRFDGADIAHVIRSSGATLDWDRLVRRATGNEGILLGHLAFYRFIFPSDADQVPRAVMEELFRRTMQQPRPDEPICRGTLVSWNQYLPDVQERGMLDGRLQPWGKLTAAEVERWTAADK